MLKDLAGEQDQLPFEVLAARCLNSRFGPCTFWKRRAGVARAIADHRNNARIKATARNCSLRPTEKTL
jgi:hypothetical protein